MMVMIMFYYNGAEGLAKWSGVCPVTEGVPGSIPANTNKVVKMVSSFIHDSHTRSSLVTPY